MLCKTRNCTFDISQISQMKSAYGQDEETFNSLIKQYFGVEDEKELKYVSNALIIHASFHSLVSIVYPVAKHFARHLTFGPDWSTIFPRPGRTAADAGRKAADEESPGSTGQG